jgi:ferredoxin
MGQPQFYPAVFDIDISVCMSCQICVEVCPFEAIKMDKDFERSKRERFDALLLRKEALSKSNEYYHRIHPIEAAAVDKNLAEAAAAAEAKKKAAAAKASPGSQRLPLQHRLRRRPGLRRRNQRQDRHLCPRRRRQKAHRSLRRKKLSDCRSFVLERVQVEGRSSA